MPRWAGVAILIPVNNPQNSHPHTVNMWTLLWVMGTVRSQETYMDQRFAPFFCSRTQKVRRQRWFPFEVMSDSGFWVQAISKDLSHFSRCVISYFSYFPESPSPSVLFVCTLPHTNWHFCFFCEILCESFYQGCSWSGSSMTFFIWGV